MTKPRRSLRQRCRSLLSGLLLVGYVVGIIGIPIPRAISGEMATVIKHCGCPVTGAVDHCCCSKPAAHSCCEPAPAPTVQTTVVIGFAARQCQGKGSDDLSAIAEVQPPPLVLWSYSWQPNGWLALESASSEPNSAVPPAPPPRTAAR